MILSKLIPGTTIPVLAAALALAAPMVPAAAGAAESRPIGAAPTQASGPAACAPMKKALDDARAGRDALGKADLAPCGGKSGAERTRCLTAQRELTRSRVEAARQKVAQARKALSCCKNPQGKSCSGG